MRHAFSLVELSIVLVILGLLTGGILAGQSLIRASELRAVSTEYSRFVSAGQTFRDKYFSLPGDFRDATRFWGRQVVSGSCVTNSSAAVNATSGVCDGDGNGQLTHTGVANDSGEVFQVWRQLALAGLIEGSYTGLSGPSGTQDTVLGTNAPRSKLTNAGYGIHTYTNLSAGHVNHYDYPLVSSWLFFGAYASGNVPYIGALKPEEAWNIDTKMDDGKPAYGKIRSAKPALMPNCASSATASAAVYLLNDSTLGCHLEFMDVWN